MKFFILLLSAVSLFADKIFYLQIDPNDPGPYDVMSISFHYMDKNNGKTSLENMPNVVIVNRNAVHEVRVLDEEHESGIYITYISPNNVDEVFEVGENVKAGLKLDLTGVGNKTFYIRLSNKCAIKDELCSCIKDELCFEVIEKKPEKRTVIE